MPITLAAAGGGTRRYAMLPVVRRRLLVLLVCALGLLGPSAGAAQSMGPTESRPQAVLALAETTADAVDLLPYLWFLAAPGETPLDALRRPELATAFQSSQRFGKPRDVRSVWARLRLRPSTDRHERWLLHISSTLIGGWTVTVYFRDESGWARQQISRRTPLAERPIPDSDAIFELDRMLQHDSEIYIHFENQVINNLYIFQIAQINAETYQHVYSQKTWRFVFYGFVFGICTIIIIYGIILFFSTRDASAAWFSASMLGFMLYFLSREGIGFEVFWGGRPWIEPGLILAPLGGTLSSLSISQFTLRFLHIENRRHWASVISSICVVIMALHTCKFAIALYTNTLMNYALYNVSAIIVSVTLVSLVCSRLRSADPAIKWVLAAFLAAATGVVLQTLLLISVIPPRVWNRHAMPLGLVLQVELLAVALSYRMRRIQAEFLEREKSEKLLLTMLPAPIAQRLKAGESPIADRHAEVTVLFADIAGFTPLSSSLPPEQVVQTLNTLFSRFDALTSARGLEKIKTIGDCYMVVGGLPHPRPDHAEAVADLALALLAAVEDDGPSADPGLRHIRIRIGLHCGSAVAGVIGRHKPAYDLWGDTVNTASRMESHGEPGRIHCSQAIYDKLAPAFEFSERREVEVRGKGRMPTYFLLRRKTP
ncbi:MAG TPA: adenylate/guanylate cyclase domain-containing protein [Pseudomonadota bacterium]|nr:adenylate/guanylate cyclase domain-containing protein [Pseudomonadota bacterium]